jgi:16S rRNA (cytidine1402-2'-O)-methyltransferase
MRSRVGRRNARFPIGRAARAAALAAGVPVTVLPGPSAVDTALVASGLVGERYTVRRLPSRGQRRLRSVVGARLVAVAVVAFEVAGGCRPRCARWRRPSRTRSGRLPRADQALRGDRTRHWRQSRRAVRRAAEGRSRARRRPRTVDEGAALAAVAELVEAGLPRRRAAELVAGLTGAAKNRLYRGSL